MTEVIVFVDIVCPWCFVGFERFERALDETRTRDKVAVSHKPFMLHGDAPPEGIDIADMLRRKYGADPRQLQARVEREAEKSGITLDLTKVTRSYSTLRAHTLIRAAEQRGTQRALVRALFHTYFIEAKSIDDVNVLADVAVQHGFARDEALKLLSDEKELAITRREVGEAYRMGVSGVPLFVFGELGALSGAQPDAVFREVLTSVASQPA